MRKIIITAIVLLVVGVGGVAIYRTLDSTSKSTANDLFPEGTEATPLPGYQDTSSTSETTLEKKTDAVTPLSPPPPAETGPLTKSVPREDGKPSMTPPTQADADAAKAAGTRKATIKTSKGTIEVELYGADAPLSVANFVKLAEAKFYQGLLFHRVEPGFVIQGGDPMGVGRGGPGYAIRREISPKLRHVEGALAWARSQDPDSAGSQFYITLAPVAFLDDNYAVFGKVTRGMEVVKKIAIGDKIISVSIH